MELADSELSDFSEEEVKRVIGVALLCTQTSPVLRPPMSRVVAMLSGDVEVSTVTSRPGYLTDWKFNDTTSFISSDISAAKSGNSTFTDPSPQHGGGTPILHEIIGDGR